MQKEKSEGFLGNTPRCLDQMRQLIKHQACVRDSIVQKTWNGSVSLNRGEEWMRN